MATHKLVRRTPGTPARTARRTPQLTRVKGPLDLQAPAGYIATAILKRVGSQSTRRIYSLWLLVGRFNEDSITVAYDFAGADAIRCDIPSGNFLSVTALQPYLRKFLKGEGKLDPDPPTIKR